MTQKIHTASDISAFKPVLDASPVPQAIHDANKSIIYLNPAFIEAFGYTLNDIPSLVDWSLKAYPDPEYRHQVTERWLGLLQNSQSDNKPFSPLEVKIRCKDDDNKTIMASVCSLQNSTNELYLITLYDTSKTKNIENKLNHALALLENVINSTPDLIAVKNTQLQTILCNEACALAVGKSREQMYGNTDIENGWDPELVQGNPEKGIRGFIHDDLDALSGKDIHNPYDPANVDGHIRIFDTHKRPLKNIHNEIIGVLLIARDVTERNDAQHKLEKSERRFRSIIEGISNIAVQAYDQKRRVIFWNPASTALYGYTKEEALGKKLEDLIIPANMRDTIITAIDNWIQQDIRIPSSEVQLQNKRGEPVTVYSSHTLQRFDDGRTELYSLDVSTSELKQTQQELQRVNTELAATLRAIPDLLFELDEDGYYINVWARNEKLLAAEKNALIGHTVAERLPEDAAKIVMQSLQEAMQTGYSHGHVISLLLPPGKLWFELSVAMKKPQKGKKTFIVLSRDITERINTEEQLRRSQKMDALGKLTGGIAHDFNNMLGVIIGYSDLLREKTRDNPITKKYVDQIITAANRAHNLTSKLLAFSRKQPTEMKPWNINDIFLEDSQMLQRTLTARVELIFDLDPELHTICINRDTFSDAILNICINAMHAMPNGGRISISTHNKTLSDIDTLCLNINAGEYIQLSIRDTGTGIRPEIKEKIFEPFFTTKDTNGTGLGLSQVYGFITQSKGDIQVHSETDPDKDTGTEFTILLPRLIQHTDRQHPGEKNKPSQQINQYDSILIVDDEAALRELTGVVLEQHGYKIFYAENAKAALKILAEENINLMLTDVIMPGMNGYQLASEVNKKYPQIKIIIASGYNDESQSQQTHNSLYQYLDKPFRSGDLLKSIRLLLN